MILPSGKLRALDVHRMPRKLFATWRPSYPATIEVEGFCLVEKILPFNATYSSLYA